jgi:sirohydrochlorin cobaltochelatase
VSRGLVLFAHGARDPRWAAPFEAVAARVRAAAGPALAIELAYLELMRPDLPEAAGRLVAAGCATIDIVPLFLGTGGHVRQDLPRLVESLRAAHPATRWRLRPAIGEADAVVDAIARAALAFAADPLDDDARPGAP